MNCAHGFVLVVKRKDGKGKVAVKYQKDGRAAQDELQMLKKFSDVPEIVQHLADGMYVEKTIELAHLPTRHNYEKKTPFMVIAMEKADRTLAECLSQGSSSPQAKLKLFGGVLRGLKAMHAQHIVHRDLTPYNTYVFGDCEDGIAKIANLGVACDTKK